MHKKRDRKVMLYVHKSSKNILLFPYVYYMGGESSAFGDAVELQGPVDPTVFGKQILRLLRACEKADIGALKDRRMARLQCYWRGGDISKDDNTLGSTWTRLLAAYPALTKGPGTFLRHFAVCQIVERDGWKHRKVVLGEQSEYRGCTVDGKIQRVSITAKPQQLAKLVLEFLAG